MKKNWHNISCTGRAMKILIILLSIIVIATDTIARYNIIPTFSGNELLQRIYVLIITLLYASSSYIFVMAMIIFCIGLFLNKSYKKAGLQKTATLSDIFETINDDDKSS